MKTTGNFFIPLFLIFFSCSNQEPALHIEVVKHAHLANLPSASGIEYSDNTIYLIGDDMRWLVSLDDDWNVSSKFALSAIDTLVNNRTPWNVKADFESIANFRYKEKDYMMVLSSGSMPITRDTAYLIQFADQQRTYKKNIRELYDKIKEQAGIPGGNEINIEGLAVSENSAYLFHRGNVNENFIVVIQLESFMNYMMSVDNLLPELKVHEFELPKYKEVPSGFSGACMMPDQSGLLFTASLEDTESELYDGAILGSFIGYIPLDRLQEGVSYSELLIENKDPVTTKLESIVIKSKTGNKLAILTVSDNDDGSSDIFEMNVSLHNIE